MNSPRYKSLEYFLQCQTKTTMYIKTEFRFFLNSHLYSQILHQTAWKAMDALWIFTKSAQHPGNVLNTSVWTAHASRGVDFICERSVFRGIRSPGSLKNCPGGSGSGTWSPSLGRTNFLEEDVRGCRRAQRSCCLLPCLYVRETRWAGSSQYGNTPHLLGV